MLTSKTARRETTASLGANPELQPELELGADAPLIVPAPEKAPTAESGFGLVLLNSGRRVMLDQTRELLVGRRDDKRGFVPDIDLGECGGYDAGVSRRHARFSFMNQICILEDLGSANGTFLNNQRLPPNQPTPIRDGDELMFGTLVMRLELRA